MHSFLRLIALAALAAAGAHASSLIVSLDDPSQIATPGQSLTFTGVISNPDVNLDDPAVNLDYDLFSIALSNASYTLNDGGFNNLPPAGVPFFLASGQLSPDIDLFDITLIDPTSDPFGTYDNSYTIYGETDGNSNDAVAVGTVEFSITTEAPASPAPEPSTFALFAGVLGGMPGLLWVSRRVMRKRKPPAVGNPGATGSPNSDEGNRQPTRRR